MRRKHVMIAGAVLALAAGGAGVAGAVGDDEDSAPATGPAAERAKAAALKLIPGGRANEVERDSENGATWEVEVQRPDGSQVDVRLDANYRKVVIEDDFESESGDSEDG